MKNFFEVFRNRRIAVTLVLGFASGLPLPLVMGTLDAWMASSHVDLKIIGLFSLVQLPYTLKVLWAPLIDRYTPPSLLHRRAAWMTTTQVLIIAFITLLGLSDPVKAPWIVALFALCLSFSSASQDIVIDAYRAELLPEKEMGAGAGVTVIGARIALLTSGAIALILSDHMPWSGVYGIMAVLMGIGLITAILSPKPEVTLPPPKSLSDAVVSPFLSFLKRQGAWEILLFILLFKAGDVIAGKMTTPFLIQIGFSKTVIGTLNKGWGMVATIFGSVVGGAVVAQIGIVNSLWLFGLLQPISNLALVALASMGKSFPMLVAAIGIENLCSGMGTVAFVAYLMSITDKHFTATQYALFTSFMAITRTLLGPVAGYLASRMAWPPFFAFCVAAAIPGLAILWRIRSRESSGGPTTLVAG